MPYNGLNARWLRHKKGQNHGGQITGSMRTLPEGPPEG